MWKSRFFLQKCCVALEKCACVMKRDPIFKDLTSSRCRCAQVRSLSNEDSAMKCIKAQLASTELIRPYSRPFSLECKGFARNVMRLTSFSQRSDEN